MSSRRRRKFAAPETEKHFVDMVEWLGMESRAEIRRMEERRRQQHGRDAEKSGETILDLVIVDSTEGLGGHQLLTFARRQRDTRMPWHRLRAGSPVVVSSYPDPETSASGVVSKRTADSIEVAVQRRPDAASFRIDLTADEVTRQRQWAAINRARDAGGRLGELREILMGQRTAEFSEFPANLTFRASLNPAQQEAVRFALAARDLAVIHGPPGTGKTTTVVELMVQAVARGERVLACAPSNTAVDNLLERLIEQGQSVVRVGHPARVGESLRQHSLDGLAAEHADAELVRQMRRESEALFRKAEKWTRAKRSRGDRQALRSEARQLQAAARAMERQTVQDILDRADVICATTTFNEELLGDRWFDLLVIDEACQSTEPGCWVPLQRANRLVLAGDHQQLPPTVLSTEAAAQGFAVSLMERQMNLWGDSIARLLNIQYRMHRDIMGFSSDQFYDNRLLADDSVATHRLPDLAGVEANELTGEVLTFIDSAGAGWDETLEPQGLSKRNPHEAELVLWTVGQLIDAGLDPGDIAVIAPYAAQVRWLRDRWRGDRSLEIDTIDGFQGREKEVVVISLVRSNLEGEIGFLADRRRMNVALTRARRKLVVIGDSATLGNEPFYRDFLEYVEYCGKYRTVWEFDLPPLG